MADGGDAGKKAPPKGKGAADDIKPTFGRAWVDFKELMKPGTTDFNQRVFLQTCPPLVKKQNEDGTEEEVEETEFEKVFEEAKSYVHLNFKLTEPIM